MVDNSIHCGGRRHRIFEDLIPSAEHKVAGDQHRAALVSLGDQSKQNLHLLPALFDIAQIVEDQGVKAVQALELGGQPEITLGSRKPLHELIRR